MVHHLHILRHILLSLCLLLLRSQLRTIARYRSKILFIFFMILDIGNLSQLSLRQLSLSILNHLQEILLFPQQILHLIIMWVFLSTFKYLLSIATHDMTSRSKMSWLCSTLGRYQNISFICFIECVADIILMVLILSLNIKFLPAFGRDKSTS